MCRPFIHRLAAPIITLTGFSGLTKLTISSPDRTMSHSDSQALGQLIASRELDHLYAPLTLESAYADMTPLARLKNLERFKVRGLVPKKPAPPAAAAAGDVAGGTAQLQAGEQQQQQQQGGAGQAQQQQQGGAAGQGPLPAPQQLCHCLAPSLPSLCFQGAGHEGTYNHESIIAQSWVLHAAGASHIQQLQLNGFWVREEFLEDFFEGVDLSPLANLTELRCGFAPEPDIGFSGHVCLPPSLTTLKHLEVIWVGTENSPYPWEQHYWAAD